MLRLALVLSVGLVAWSGHAPKPDAPRLGTEADRPDASTCDITIRGHHGGAHSPIRLSLSDSDVRNRTGVWTNLDDYADAPPFVEVRPGGSFSFVNSRFFGCSANRRWRFYFTTTVEGQRYEYTHYYPSARGNTRETVIDLGDVSRFFDAIEPGPPPVQPAPSEPTDTHTAPLPDLDGEWVRRESNNNPNDGMRVRVGEGQGVLTFVPHSASSNWVEGEVLWQGLQPTGTLEVLGSDDNYYTATITADGPTRLHIDIAHNGAGNDQTWERQGPCWPPASGSDVRVSASGGLPSGLIGALRDAETAGASIGTVAVDPSGEWIVVADGVPCYSSGFSPPLRDQIDRLVASGHPIDVVAFGSGGRFLVVAGESTRRSGNVSDDAVQAIREAQREGRAVTSFTFSPDPDSRWAMSAGGVGETGRNRVKLGNTIRAAEAGLRPVHEIATGPNDEWVLVAEDWFVTHDAPPDMRSELERLRTDEVRRIDHVLFHERDDRMEWAIISNSPEPTPTASDKINTFEQQLTGDSTVYQRMKTHRITGLAVALVENNEVAWTRTYGLRRVDFPEEYVYPATLFDAASISKPVAYASALKLVERGDLSFETTGVLYDLAGDELPGRQRLNRLRADEISLAHLLSHCAGIQNSKGSSGAQEVPPGERLPTLKQMVQGSGPASGQNRVIRVDSVEVGESFDYSGANSLLVQALIEHHADGGFDAHVEGFLDEVGIESGTFRTDFLSFIPREAFAHGHLVAGGGPMTTRIMIYPNQAAAGLRVTAGDLARFIILLNQRGSIGGRRVLQPGLVDLFLGRDLSPSIADRACDDARGSEGNQAWGRRMKLGINTTGLRTENEMFTHGGLHNGYRTYLSGLPNRQGGVVLFLTGSLDDADDLRDEIRAALRAAYSWDNL